MLNHEARTDVYEVLDAGGARLARETFALTPGSEGFSVSSRRTREGSGGHHEWTVAFDVSASGVISAIRAAAGPLELKAEYRWETDRWVGHLHDIPAERVTIRTAQQGTHVLCSAIASDFLLLRRASPRENCQERLEALEFHLATRRWRQTHRLIEHLGMEERMFPTGRQRAARYRVVRPDGSHAELWVRDDGILLQKRFSDGRTWRLLPGASRLDKEGLLKDSAVFCMHPWTNLYVHPDGRALTCCVSELGGAVGDTRKSTFEQLWNSEGLRRIRLDMLEGKPVSSCSRCYHMEEAGLGSPRLSQNRNFEHHFPAVEATAADGDAGRVNLAYMDIRFSNLCNFKCRSCGVTVSSAWYDDHIALGRDINHGPLVAPMDDPEELWRQIEPHLSSVERIYFAGGEPLIMEEHYRILRALLAMKKFDVALTYSTNFSRLSYKGQDVTELWDRFQDVEVQASLDGMDQRGEYLRKNQDWSQVLINRERLRRECPRVKFVVKPTLTVMNALHLPDFHRRWLEEGLISPGQLHLTIAEDPEEYSVQILPPHIKRQVVESYEQHIDRELKPRGATLEEGLFRSVLAFLQARDSSHLTAKFRERTRALDDLRGENFAAVFPELAELMLTDA